MIYFSRWKVSLILAICVLGLAFAAPNFLASRSAEILPDWLPHKQVNLGLDLQGGSHLLLSVETEAVIREYLEAMVDGARTELRQARIRYRELGIMPGEGSGISVIINNPEELDQAVDLLRNLEPNMVVRSDNDGRITVVMDEQAAAQRKRAAIQQSIEIVRRRIDETGVREPTIQSQGDDRILVQLPGVDDPERVKRLLGKTAKMAFHLVDTENSVNDAIAGRVPPGSVLMESTDEVDVNGQPRKYLIRKRVMVGGETLVDSQPGFDQRNNQPIVTFRFDTRGAKKFGDVTSKNVNRPFAIVLDGKVISAPVIREPILGGSGQISGSFTVQDAQDLALLLRAGALPA
nr:protein translocase subunit SecD [Alphaproteobacteria bacterium]